MTRINTYILLLTFAFIFTIIPVGNSSSAPINMNVTNAEVRDVLTALAAVGGVSLVADDSVTGKVTITLSNVNFDTALEIVTKAKGLTYHKVGNVLVITNREKMNKGFGSIEVIKLNYAKASEVKKSLALVIPEERLKVDEASNSLVFMGSTIEIAEVRRVLKDLDYPFQQISLEAQVIALDKTASKDLGIDWEWSTLPAQLDNSSDSTSSSDSSSSSSTNYGGAIRFGNGPNGPYQFQFQAKLSALMAEGKAEILAKPNITAIDGKEARILIGDRIPVLVEKKDNGQSTTTIEYVDAGIKLIYTPRINADGMITAAVHTEVSTPTLIPAKDIIAYRISTREAQTTVRMKDGETMVIGGLIGKQESSAKNKIPFLGDLPVLGKLFQSVHKNKSETEVMIFLTARIVN